MRVGTFFTLQDAKDAHQRALMLDNPDLHTATATADERGLQRQIVGAILKHGTWLNADKVVR
jgi:hypothetical protein